MQRQRQGKNGDGTNGREHGLWGGGDDREKERNRGIRVSHVEHLA